MTKGEESPLLESRLPNSYRPANISLAPEKMGVRFIELFMMFIGTCGAIGMGLMPLLFYYFFGQLIGKLTNPDEGPPTLEQQKADIQQTSYYFFGIAGIAGICSLIQYFCFIFSGERIAVRVRRELFKAITRQEIAYFDETGTGELIAKLSEDCQQIRDAFSDRIGQIFVSLAQFCAGMGFAFTYSWQLTLVMISVAPLMAIAVGFQGRFLIKFTKLAAQASGQAISVAEEVIGSFRTVRSFSQEEKEVRRFVHELEQVLSVAKKRAFFQGSGVGLVQMMVWGACAVSFYFGGYLVGQSELFFGDLVTVFGMMLFACLGLSLGFAALPELAKGRASYIRVRDIVNRQPRVPFEGGNTLDRVEGQVTFDNVKFRYVTRDVDVLQGVSFEVPVGSTVAFVGESGSGKSTIFSLIERFYECTDGTVKIDGYDIRQLDPRWLHKHLSMVSQEPVLFATTIAENISYARDGATQKEIEDAARTANAHEFIVGMPNGYNTKVGERGVQLSGGQKQRIAIARAILANPKILLLDEATSALDTESEQLVQEALDRLMKGRTTLCIAHRLATVREADCIFVLSKGRIVGQGTHNELLENSEEYSNLARRQLTLQNAEEEM